eukprot:TRINITY_DN67114_c0_g1_i1.p1 TRINITY_DN67114_c0_g1~~TRINITY_DN67114_c0_g1_i1.p1  ORF type:complete len:136 (+),score=20.49 TRINITY_DN67114_c0_g1_i1:29-409(+)
MTMAPTALLIACVQLTPPWYLDAIRALKQKAGLEWALTWVTAGINGALDSEAWVLLYPIAERFDQADPGWGAAEQNTAATHGGTITDEDLNSHYLNMIYQELTLRSGWPLANTRNMVRLIESSDAL